MEPFIVTANVTVVVGEQRIELTAGEAIDVKALPRGKWQSLINTRGIVPQSEYERMFSPAVRGVEPPPVAASAVAEEGDFHEDEAGEEIPAWQLTPVKELGLRDEAVIAYQGAGLVTVRDLLVYGATHGSLATLRGIGEATEKATHAAIEKIMPPAEDAGDQPA